MFDINVGVGAERIVEWLLDHVSPVFDAVSAGITRLVEVVTLALTQPPQAVLVVVFTVLALYTRRWTFVVYTALAFLLVAGMGLWTQTMQTLALVIVAAVIAIVLGVPLGIWAAYSRAVSVTIRPVLDLMQTLPVFVYLIPAVFFFGIGSAPGVIATIVFALPPAVRLTELGIRQVDREVVEAAEAFGSRRLQILREIHLPLAARSIMAGVNQVIMLSLSMVVIAGLVGADGLGTVVVRAVSRLEVGNGFESGLAVVVLAIYLDRLTTAFAEPRQRKPRRPARPDAAPVERLAETPTS